MKVHETKEIFNVIEFDEDKEKKVAKTFKIVVGNNVVSAREFKTLQSAKDYINQKPYELIFNTMFGILNNILKKENNENNEKSK